jgi:hypothetical protein
VNFSQGLNLSINPEQITETANSSYKDFAQYIASTYSLWSKPFSSFETSSTKYKVKALIAQKDFAKAINIIHDYMILETKKNLTNIIATYPQELKDGIPTTMIIFGGFANAISFQLALAKVLCRKLVQEDISSFISVSIPLLRKPILEFSKIQIATLKLVENLNGVISNQEKPYDFNPDYFELSKDEEGYLLSPTKEFLDQVITLANDPKTIINSYNYEVDAQVPFIEKHSFAAIYSKPKGCPIHASKTNSETSLMAKYLDQVESLLLGVF